MSATITLSDAEKKAVIAFHENNVEDIRAQISELNEQMAQSLYRISELTGNGNKYSSSWPLWKKVQYALVINNVGMTTKELSKQINDLDGRDPDDIRDLVSAISATLKPKIDKKDTFGREDIGGEHYYGLIEWFDEDGLKMEYAF